MTGPRVDMDLLQPPAPKNVRVLEGLEGVLALPGPSGPAPFLVEGGLVRIRGEERGGVTSVRLAGKEVVTELVTNAGVAANMVATPSTIRRELIGRSGSVQEAVLATATLPAAAVQWRAGTDRPLMLTIRFRLAPGQMGLRYAARGHALVVHAQGEEEDQVVLFNPPPAAWTVQEAPGGGLSVQVEAEAGAGQAVTLAVATGTAKRRAGLTVLEHLHLHERRSQAPPWDDGGLRLDTGVPELDEGLGWISARLLSNDGSQGAQTRYGLLWWGLGALACGLPEPAGRALAHLTERHPESDHAVLLAARFALTTGNQASAREMASRLLAHGAAPGRSHASATEQAQNDRAGRLTQLARAALADALRYAAPDEDIDELRRLALLAEPTPPSVTLPMIGEAGGAESEGLAKGVEAVPGWLSALIQSTEASIPGTPLAAAARLVSDLGTDHPDAYVSWREQVAAGLAGGPGGRGTWDDPGALAGAPVAGALACGLVHGLLGWVPDGPVGRLGLSPILPAHLNAFTVRDIGVGDARLDLEYARDGGEHSYVLTPTHGRVPPTLAFAPRLVARRVRAAFVDNEAAELDVVKTRDRTTVSVQIPLDGRRTVRLSTDV